MFKNKIFIIFIVLIIVLCSVSSFLGYKYYKTKEKLENNKPIHCVVKDKSGKMEISFDFKNEHAYRYSIISTNKMNDSINVEKYQEIVAKYNATYKGAVEKFWTDNKVYVLMDIYNLDLMDEIDFKKTTNMSLKELKEKTRQEILDSIIPMATDSFECD